MNSGFNMAAHVLAQVGAYRDKPALELLGASQPEIWTYGALERAVRGVATGLLQSGFTPGDRILLRLGNRPEFPIAFLACLSVDLIPVPTSALLTEPEISDICASLHPAGMIAETGVALPEQALHRIDVRDLTGFHDLPPAPYAIGDPERPGYIIYTSGTSGRARGVIHAHRAILARQHMFEGWYGLRPTDRLLHAGAFNWTYTLGTGLMDPWTRGATALIPIEGTPVTALPQLLAAHRATLFAAAPGVYRQILRHNLPPLPALRHGLSAGEKLPNALRRSWVETTGTAIYEAFGMSECSTFISGCPARPAPEGSLGYPQPGRRIALLDDTGREADSGTIAIHRTDPGLMLGYLGQDDETAACYHGDWFLTGDLASRADDGALTYLGRNDDMMNAGGYRVSPIEVESVLTTHPDIDEAAAVALTVKADTTVIGVFYTGPKALGDAELSAFTRPRLARYKQPRLFIHMTALPRGANNKLLRRQLRQEWETRHGQT